MAKIRLEHQDMNLKDIGELLDPPVGKSGVNHRLRKISEMADEIRAAGRGIDNKRIIKLRRGIFMIDIKMLT